MLLHQNEMKASKPKIKTCLTLVVQNLNNHPSIDNSELKSEEQPSKSKAVKKKSKSKQKGNDKSHEKGLFDVSNIQSEQQNEGEDNESKDSIAEYEKIISEKLEEKRKEELKKASEHMKVKLLKTGRCPI